MAKTECFATLSIVLSMCLYEMAYEPFHFKVSGLHCELRIISSAGPTFNQLEQAVQYNNRLCTGPTFNQLEQAVQYNYRLCTGPTFNQLE